MKKLLLIVSLLIFYGCTPEMIAELRKLSEFHVLVIGDSQSFGGFDDRFNTTVVEQQSLWEWEKGEFIQDEKGFGFYPKMSDTIKALTGQNTYLYNLADGNTYYKHWNSDELYISMIQNAQSYLVVNDLKKFDAIYVRVGGLDALQGGSLEEIHINATEFYNKLLHDFPEAIILLGKAPLNDEYSDRFRYVRALEEKIIVNNDNVYELYDMDVSREEASEVSYDGKHLYQWYSDKVGTQDGIIISELIGTKVIK